MDDVNSNQAIFNAKQIAEAMPRAQRALRLREAGETWATIGQLLGVSRERARQLAAKARKHGA